MKKAIAFLISALALVCGFAQAGTGTLAEQFVSANGISFSIHDARAISATSEAVTLTFHDGSNSAGYLADNAGVLYNTIKASTAFKQAYVKLYGVETWINLSAARWLVCSNDRITVGWTNTGSSDYADPGCGVYSSIRAYSN